MKLNVDCIRAVLLELEKTPYGIERSPEYIIKSLLEFNEDDIRYSLLKLEEAGYINATYFKSWGTLPTIESVIDITYAGHEFLNSVRDSKIWRNTKDLLATVGSMSLPLLTNVATTLITNALRQLM